MAEPSVPDARTTLDRERARLRDDLTRGIVAPDPMTPPSDGRIDARRLPQLAHAVMRAAEDVSFRLGWGEQPPIGSCPLSARPPTILGPRDEDHVLDRAARIRASNVTLLFDEDRDRERRVRRVTPGLDDLADRAERRALLDHDEVPWLEVLCARREAAGLDDPSDGLGRDGAISETPDREHRAYRFEDLHFSPSWTNASLPDF